MKRVDVEFMICARAHFALVLRARASGDARDRCVAARDSFSRETRAWRTFWFTSLRMLPATDLIQVSPAGNHHEVAQVGLTIMSDLRGFLLVMMDRDGHQTSEGTRWCHLSPGFTA